MEPEKPFACTLPDCGMTFTNEDHLHVHTKKHDMVLQLGLEQKAAFVADQTPTPTRFIRNCEEVGLFQDLQNVNPFDEGFKRAMETKHSNLSLEGGASSADDVLHTPHMMFPMMDPGDCSLYSTTNNHRNITISRSSSDESGAVKEYETTTISKLTNEVTTISRVVGKPDVLDRVTTTDDVSIVRHEETARNKDGINETSVSYTKIHSNVEIRKDNVNIESKAPVPIAMMSYSDAAIKDATVTKDVLVADGTRLQVPEKIPPMMSQKSLDYVVDSLATECRETVDTAKTLKRNYSNVIKADVNLKHIEENAKGDEDYEVIIKLPNGKQVRMKAVEETERTVQKDTKERLKKTIASKVDKIRKAQTASLPNPQIVTNVVPITGGTLIPVTIVNPIISTSVPKIPILPFSHTKNNYKTVRRKVGKKMSGDNPDSTVGDGSELSEEGVVVLDDDEDAQRKKTGPMSSTDSRSAASKRYRERLKESMRRQSEENKHLRELSQRLISEKAVLKLIITEHLKKCPIGDDLRTIQESLQKISQ